MKVLRWCSFLSFTMASVLTAAPSKASDDWWFDVEVIVFERKLDLTQLDEQFELADSLAPPLVEADVIGDAIAPNISWLKQGLGTCDKAPLPQWPAAYTSEQANNALLNGPTAPDTPSPELADERTQEAPASSEVSAVDAVASNAEHVTAQVQSSPDLARPSLRSPIDGNISVSAIAAIAQISETTVPKVPEVRACEPSHPWLSYRQGVWHKYQPDNRLPAPQSLPITPEGFDWPNASHAHLLSSSAQQLTSLSRQIRQNRDLTRLLHVTWRQPVMFGKNNAFNVRLFAGENYAHRFTLAGEPLPSQDADLSDTLTAKGVDEFPLTPMRDFFDSLEQKLSAPSPIDLAQFNEAESEQNASNNEALVTESSPPIWQLDGNLKVYLKYINRVPYLHIDSQLFYRQPIPLDALTADENRVEATELAGNNATPTAQPDYRLVSVPFSEQRRVISKQLHYFDHPLFGMVVEIRRYNRPPSPSQ